MGGRADPYIQHPDFSGASQRTSIYFTSPGALRVLAQSKQMGKNGDDSLGWKMPQLPPTLHLSSAQSEKKKTLPRGCLLLPEEVKGWWSPPESLAQLPDGDLFLYNVNREDLSNMQTPTQRIFKNGEPGKDSPNKGAR